MSANATGGEVIAGLLAANGVGTVFSLAGAGHTYLLDPLDRQGTRIVSSRHESGAVGAADGYARVRAELGVALVIAEQGLPNAIGAIAAAWHACSPVLVLVASAPRAQVEADTAIDQDRLALVAPISKWARTVPCAERLADHVLAAIRHATSGRQGPAVLLVPEQLLQASVALPPAQRLPRPAVAPPAGKSIRAAADLLQRAERPLVIAGGGAAWSGAGDALSAFGKRFGLPVLGNSLGRGQVAEDNVLGFAWPYAQIAAHRADVVLVVGARLTQRLGMGLPPRFARDAKFVQIDVDAAAFHRNRPTDVPVLGDARRAVEALHAELEDRGQTAFDNAWLENALSARRARIDEIVAAGRDPVHPLALGAALMQRLPAGAQVVGDGADIQNWMYGVLRIDRPRGFLDHYPMGAMGSGTALAVGAAAAHREVSADAAPLTVLVTGDGSLGFHPAELHAAAAAGLDLLVVVGNDAAWGTEKHGQLLAIGRSVNTELGALPYEKLGEAFGGRGYRIESTDRLAPVLDEALAASGVRVVNVILDPDAGSELKTNPDVRMIVFSDIVDGQAELGGD